MGLFDLFSGGDSSSSSATTVTTTTRQTDKRVGAADGSFVAQGRARIEIDSLDPRVAKAALQANERTTVAAIEALARQTVQAQRGTNQALKGQAKLTDSALAQASGDLRSFESFLQSAVWVAAIGGAAWVFTRSGR